MPGPLTGNVGAGVKPARPPGGAQVCGLRPRPPAYGAGLPGVAVPVGNGEPVTLLVGVAVGVPGGAVCVAVAVAVRVGVTLGGGVLVAVAVGVGRLLIAM